MPERCHRTSPSKPWKSAILTEWEENSFEVFSHSYPAKKTEGTGGNRIIIYCPLGESQNSRLGIPSKFILEIQAGETHSDRMQSVQSE